MKLSLKHLLWIGCAAAALLFVAPNKTVRADDDDYWKDYWHWYDGSYRPYYYQQPYQSYGYYDGNAYYNNGYYNDGYYNNGYNGYYGNGYYGGQPGWGMGYQRYNGYYGGPRNAVQHGPLHFGWR